MPFKSKAQARFMYKNHPKIARRWSREAKAKGQKPYKNKPNRKRR